MLETESVFLSLFTHFHWAKEAYLFPNFGQYETVEAYPFKNPFQYFN